MTSIISSHINYSSLKSTSFVILLTLAVCVQFILINAHGGISHGHNDSQSGDSNGNSTTTNNTRKNLIIVKIWCLVIFLGSTFAFGVSPYFLRWNETFLVLGTQFAGGVFLGTSMIHFLSDASSVFKGLTTLHYPFAFMLACGGYVVTMLGDCIVMHVDEKSEGKRKVGVEDNGGNRDEEEERVVPVRSPMFMKTTSVGNTVLLIVALCFHSIFEGIAVGIADNEADAWKNLWTIALHKVLAAIAMGIALLRMIPKRPFLATVVYSLAFAISSPIGIGIGIAIDATTEGRAADWTYAISMGFATGIFIYVAINHLINKGYKPHSPCYFDTPFYRFFAVFLGVAVLAVVMIWD